MVWCPWNNWSLLSGCWCPTIQRAMWNFSFLKLHVSVETFLSIYLSMVCLHTDLAESYPYFPQVGISLGKCSPIIFTTSWTCYCFWKDSMAGETQASCNCSHKVGTVSPQTIFFVSRVGLPHPKIKNIFGFQLIGTVDTPRDGVKSWNAKQLTDACFQSSMFFFTPMRLSPTGVLWWVRVKKNMGL